jgi:hypothetical protein
LIISQGNQFGYSWTSVASRIRSRVAAIAQEMTEYEARRTTIAVAEVTLADGSRATWVAGAGRTGYVPPNLRAGGLNVPSPAKPWHTSLPSINDAERHLLRAANREGAVIEAIGATRAVCLNCQSVIPRYKIVTRVKE